METASGTVPFREHETWYQVFGDLKDERRRPLVVLHGGPGVTHAYLLSLRDLNTLYGIPVIFYDQVGCGKSTRLPHKGPEFWTVDFFLDELDNLLIHLDIQHDYDIVGQSWGSMLGLEHAVRQPKGLKHLVLGNCPADNSMWDGEMSRLLAGLPVDIQETLKQHEAAGTTDSPAYQKAMHSFYAKHVCRLDPMPEDLQRTFEALAEDNTVYGIMCGPSEFHVTGTLKDWTIVDRLHNVKASTLVINGLYDEVTDKIVAPLVEGIPAVQWVKFLESSHMPHLEEREEYMRVVNRFLTHREPFNTEHRT